MRNPLCTSVARCSCHDDDDVIDIILSPCDRHQVELDKMRGTARSLELALAVSERNGAESSTQLAEATAGLERAAR